MISAEFKTVYEQSSEGWPPDAKAFCLAMLSAMEHLESRIKTLEDKLAVNSQNSSSPPSQDGFKKAAPSPMSLRKKSGKKLHQTVGENKRAVRALARWHSGPALAGQGRHRKEYRRLIALGLENNPPALKEDGSARGRTAQSKTVNLLLRLRDKEDEVLRFMTHEHARFDNNQAERDLRMNKVRQKASGGFRSLQAGKEFMDVRSFIATAIKQGADPIEELVHLFTPGGHACMRLARHPE
jgi:hypothetical protein